MSEASQMGYPRFERIKPALACPKCRCELDFSDDAAECVACKTIFPIRQGRVYFVTPPHRGDSFDSLKGKLKKHLGRLYYTVGVAVFAPTYPFCFLKEITKYVQPDRELVVDMGCGAHRLHENIICLDLFDYDNVDIVCDLDSLPFRENSIDAFVSRSVLEHLPRVWEIVAGLQQCTKSGGYGMHLIPFLFPFHASPHDFVRFTEKGASMLFGQWKTVCQFNATGPATLFLLMTIELFSILFSFGSSHLRNLLYLLLCAVLFPLKYLDALFVRNRRFMSLAPSIFTVVEKP